MYVAYNISMNHQNRNAMNGEIPMYIPPYYTNPARTYMDRVNESRQRLGLPRVPPTADRVRYNRVVQQMRFFQYLQRRQAFNNNQLFDMRKIRQDKPVKRTKKS